MTLQATTSKSTCIDISSPYDMELIELYSLHKIPTGYYGPIPPGTMGLILGRSSCTMRGLMVLTGVMDEDYEGEIHIMVNVMKMGNVYLQKREHLHNYYFYHILNQGRHLINSSGKLWQYQPYCCTIHLIKGISEIHAYFMHMGKEFHRHVTYQS